MQSNNQINQLIDSLNGQPLAVSPGYWQTVESEVSTLAGSMTGAEIERRKAAVAARLMSSTGQPVVAGPANLNDSTGTPSGSIAHLQLSGVMLSHDFLWFRGVNHLTAELTAADSNPSIAGVLLEVNSGGGMVTAGQMLAATIAGMSKPVVVLTHFMASAAIMGTLPANKIVASSPGAEIGSIGTMVKVDKWVADMNKKRYHVIYADKSTNKNNDHRAAQDGDYAPLAKRVNQINEMFLQSVRTHRLLKGDVKGTLSGGMFMAKDAKARGLIDDIGGQKKALFWLAHSLKYKETPGHLSRLNGSKASSGTSQPIGKPVRAYHQTEINQAAARLAGRKGPRWTPQMNPRNQRMADRLAGKK